MNVGRCTPCAFPCFALLFWLRLGLTTHAAILTVTSTADSGAGTLRDTIASANLGDTIVFTSSLSGQTIQLTSGELAIGKNLTIGGTAFTVLLTAGANSRLIEITTGNVTLNSLTLENAHLSGTTFPANSGGGAFVDSGASLAANNCSFMDDSATNGGGIFNLGTLMLNNCTVASDSASGGCGGGIYNSNGVVTLNGCTISSDIATHGGGICNSNGTATLINCTLAINNTPSGFGGAIENDGLLQLNNCTVSANSAIGGSGGGIYNSPSGAVLVMTNTIVAGNNVGTSTDISGSYSGVNNLVASPPYLYPLGSFGGLTQTMPPAAGSPVIDAGTDLVTNYLATDQRGLPRLAGPHVDIGAAEFAPNTVMTSADSIPGSLRYAITYTSGGSVITFASTMSGEAIHLSNGELLLGKNLTIDASAPGGIFIDGGHASRVFEISNATVTFNDLTITNGYVTNDNGGGVLIDFNSSVALHHCTFSANAAADGLGGGLFNQGNLTVHNCLFSANSANSGGGLYSLGVTAMATVNNSSFLENSAVSVGGGLENDASLSLYNCTFAANTAQDGSGVGNYYSGAISIINCTVADNLGGGIGIDAAAGPVGITNTIATGNVYYDISGAYSGVNNFIGGNPQLAPLDPYGGATPSMPPMFGSPVIDAGSDSVSTFLSSDQRGYPRLSGAHVDIGAVEAQTVPVASAPVLKGTLSGNSFKINFTTAAADFTALTSTNIALPLSSWTVLGNAAVTASGQYQFTDTSATNSEQFYQVVSP